MSCNSSVFVCVCVCQTDEQSYSTDLRSDAIRQLRVHVWVRLIELFNSTKNLNLFYWDSDIKQMTKAEIKMLLFY